MAAREDCGFCGDFIVNGQRDSSNFYVPVMCMSPDLPERFRQEFFASIRADDSAESLKQSALAGRLGEWTRALTTVAVRACQRMGWPASGRANKLNLLPVQRSEYLALDVMAFADGQKRWRYPNRQMLNAEG